MAAIRTGGDPPGRRLVFALLAFVPRRRGTPCRAGPARRSCHHLEVGAELRPGNGTPFALEAQTDQRQLAGGRVDETYIRVKGKWVYLYRAVDSDGATIDFLLSARRDTVAATLAIATLGF
jgi:hypothetical protein